MTNHQNELYSSLSLCTLCRSKDLKKVVPLASMPLKTPTFEVKENAYFDKSLESAPLDLNICESCGNLQVGIVINPDFHYINYVYETSSSLGLVDHFQKLSDEVVSDYPFPRKTLVVEIGSNDGSLLAFFKRKGYRVIGVDPAKTIAKKATDNGIPTRAEFFNTAVASDIERAEGKASIIIANNVTANISDLGVFTSAVKGLLADDGIFVFETQYGPDVIEHMLLDTIYTEHLSYFPLRPLRDHFTAHGMQVIDVKKIPTKGGSIRTVVQKSGGVNAVSSRVTDLIEKEEEKGVFSAEFYSQFVKKISAMRQQLHGLIDTEIAKGNKIGGYGVSPGTSTLLHQFDLPTKISYLFDDNPEREEFLSGPGYNIPVMGMADLDGPPPSLIVIFAWRYSEAIIEKNRGFLEQGGLFVIPLPSVVVIRTVDDLKKWKKQARTL